MGKEDMLKNKTAVITGASRGIGKAILLFYSSLCERRHACVASSRHSR